MITELPCLEEQSDLSAILELPPESRVPRTAQIVTAFILGAPFVGLVAATVLLFGRGVTILDLVLLFVFYAISGHGATAGYHRMAADRSFVATRATKICLCLAGSLAFEGGPIAWVANHRRHHAYTDLAGDPHSPHVDTHDTWPRVGGVFHAHVGWLLSGTDTDAQKWAPDLMADHDLVVIDRIFPVMCLASLGAPTLLGYAFTGTAAGAIGGLLWGGLVRVFLLQHATFAVNSACHIWGTRNFKTRCADRSTNFAPLAIFAMGENWHNLHHSNPTFARHGVDRGQLDSTARIIRILELTGRVTNVRWPSKDEIECRRKSSDDLISDQAPVLEKV